MKTLIIGAGEVGKSLGGVLSEKYEVIIRDKEALKVEGVEVLNICYPFFNDFVKVTKEYIRKYRPKLTIIHSTVPPGTTEKCGDMVVHSPIHGKHPNLSLGIKTFVKYIGGSNPYAVNLAQAFLKNAGIQTYIVGNAKTSELSKILCTTYFGWNIVFMKEAIKICEQHGVSFHEVYYNWNAFYNSGYERLGMSAFKRPVLEPMPGGIGGHCVVPNCHLFKSDITDFIIKKNEEYKRN